jgi:mono/diheme cytochrome c family protein
MKHDHHLAAAFIALGVSGLMTALPPTAGAATPNGKAVFDRNCSVCHSIMPPPKSAPPIAPIASRYRQQFPSKSQGVAHMAAFIKSPSKQKVIVDRQAVDRFGLMPPIQLSDAEINAVAGWVWDQGAAKGWGPGSGAGRGNGNGNCNQSR